MAQPNQLTQIAFATGIDESQEPEVLDPTSAFPAMLNGRQDRKGGYSKRLAFTSLTSSRSDGTARSSGRRLFLNQGRVCTVDSTPEVDSYDETQGTSYDLGRVPEVSVTRQGLALSVTSTLLDLAYCNGYKVTLGIAAQDAGNTYLIQAAVETADGSPALSQRTIAGGSAASATVNGLLGTYGVYVFAITTDTATANISCKYLDTTSAATIAGGWHAMTSLATNKVTSGVQAYIISAVSLSDRVAFAYVNNGGGTNQVTVKTFDQTGVLQSTNVDTASTTPNVVGVGGSSSDRLWVCWNQSTTIKLIGLNPSTITSITSTAATVATTSAAPNVNAPVIVPSTTAGAGRVLVQEGNGVWFTTFVTTLGAVVKSGTEQPIYGVGIGARGFLRSGRYYCPFHFDSGNSQSLFILCDFTDVQSVETLRPVANIFPGLVPGDLNVAHVWPWVESSDVVSYAVAVDNSAASPKPCVLVSLDFAGDRWRAAEINNSTHLTGGVFSYVDGATVSEVGFLHAPSKPTTSVAGTGLTGTYRYVCVYEGVDRAGNWVLSGASLPSNPQVAANQTITVSTRPLSMTNRDGATLRGKVGVSFFRTTSTGEPPYYFVRSLPNDSTSGTISLSDALGDSSITSNRLLYANGNLPGTNGAALDRRAPPFAQCLVPYGDMMVIASGSDLWWSGQVIGGEALWFNPAFSLTVPGSGDVVALAAQDGTLFVFKSDSIYATAGEAPSDNGTSGGLGTPRKLASDVGAVSPITCVSTFGIWFVSERGIELLTRSGAVEWIGEPVQETFAAYPNVTSIVLDDKNNLVRVTLSNFVDAGVATGTGVSVIYDLALRAWVSVDDYTGVTGSESAQDAAMVTIGGERRYAWLGTDGTLWYERLANDASAHLDGSSWVTLSVVTAWFKAAGVQGRQALNRVLVMARKRTDCDLYLALAYNYETSFRADRHWLSTDISALLSAGWPITQLKHDAHNDSECQSVRLSLTDGTPTGGTVGSGRGLTLLALSLDIAPQTGMFEVPEEAA